MISAKISMSAQDVLSVLEQGLITKQEARELLFEPAGTVPVQETQVRTFPRRVSGISFDW